MNCKAAESEGRDDLARCQLVNRLALPPARPVSRTPRRQPRMDERRESDPEAFANRSRGVVSLGLSWRGRRSARSWSAPALVAFSATRPTLEMFVTPTRRRTLPKAGEGSRTPRRDRAHRALPDLRQFLQCVHPSGALKFGRGIWERIGFASGIGRADVVAFGDERTPTKARRPLQRREPFPSVRAVAVCSCSGQTAP